MVIQGSVKPPAPQDPPATGGGDGYEKLFTLGVGGDSHFVSGEHSLNGTVQWVPDADSELDLSIDDPRYQRCLETAHQLKKQYPLTGLDPQKDHSTLVERERAIVSALTTKIHEEYGGYNSTFKWAIIKKRLFGIEKSDEVKASTHHDWTRAWGRKKDWTEPSPGEPPITIAKLSEFKKDELVCRHYSPLASALLTEAGLPNAQVGGYMVPGGKIGNFSYLVSPEAHAWTVSRLTGNIIEATTSGNSSYKETQNGVSFEETLAGKDAIVNGPSLTEGVVYVAYSTGATGTEESNNLIDQRLALIKQKQLDNLPNDSFYDKDGKWDSRGEYDTHAEKVRQHSQKGVARLPGGVSLSTTALGLGALLGGIVATLSGMGWLTSFATLAIGGAVGWLAGPTAEKLLDSRGPNETPAPSAQTAPAPESQVEVTPPEKSPAEQKAPAEASAPRPEEDEAEKKAKEQAKDAMQKKAETSKDSDDAVTLIDETALKNAGKVIEQMAGNTPAPETGLQELASANASLPAALRGQGTKIT